MKIIEYSVSKAISKSGMMELDYAINPYSGCFHRCLYCYAIDYTHHKDAASNWGEIVYVKKNIDLILKRDIIGLPRGIVGLGTITDPYQPVEATYRLSRKILEILLRNGFRVTVQTKSPLVTRDVDVLSLHRSTADVGITITTINRAKSLMIETKTPSPSARITALGKLNNEGIKTWIFLGPIIRNFNDDDENLRAIFEAAVSTGSRVIYDFYSSYKGANSMMERYLPRHDGRKEFNESNVWKREVVGRIAKLAEKYNVECNSQKDEWLVERGYNFGELL
ncbi:MAG: radical SAM protein [Thermoplasmatales archaeon]|nr:radical SAM protein [Thermoplasmatales archaeon]MCW6169711.1 radical SAM protein [Thermoplasmatales archaeon]